MEYFIYDNGPDWVHYKVWFRMPGIKYLYCVDNESMHSGGYSIKYFNEAAGLLLSHKIKKVTSLEGIPMEERTKKALAEYVARFTEIMEMEDRDIYKEIAELRLECAMKRMDYAAAKNKLKVVRNLKARIRSGRVYEKI